MVYPPVLTDTMRDTQYNAVSTRSNDARSLTGVTPGGIVGYLVVLLVALTAVATPHLVVAVGLALTLPALFAVGTVSA